MGYVQDAVGPSVPPPGWTPSDTPQAPVPVSPAAVGGADAAVRWRISAAGIDTILVTLAYLLVCAVLHWRVAGVGHAWLASVLAVAYYFGCEAHNGQTIGKRQYGLRVVSADGGPADARAIAIRTVLRFVDALPTCYASGLVTMLRTGRARRQRIGDVAARTMVVAVDGRAADRGTPGWMLPVATIVALLLSALLIFGVAHSTSQPISATNRAAFMAGCERSGGASPEICECVLARLEAEGYNTTNAQRQLLDHLREDAASGTLGPDSRNLLAAATVCRPTPPVGPIPPVTPGPLA
jgi:uncharacterized RDD family membrane protein YckC